MRQRELRRGHRSRRAGFSGPTGHLADYASQAAAWIVGFVSVFGWLAVAAYRHA
jgi:hypothetical protein